MTPDEAGLLVQLASCAVGGWATGKLLVVLAQLTVETAYQRLRRAA